MTLRKCLTILCDCLVYFDNGNCIKKTTFVTYSLLESSQFSELSLSSVFPANLFILIKRNENGIWMDLYHKPTDTQRCLPFTSSHPNHCKRNIPFCLARRICTIAENNAEKLKNLENLKSNLSKYNYPDSLIKQGFQKTLSIPQKDLRKPKKSSNKNILPFDTTFNPNNPNIYSTIKSSVNCLKVIALTAFIILN